MPALPEPRGGAAPHPDAAGAGGRPAQHSHQRRWHRVRPAARLPARRRVPPHRLAGHRSPAAPDREAVPRRAEPERGAAARQRPGDGRHGRRCAARGTRDGCGARRGAGGHQVGRSGGHGGLRSSGAQHRWCPPTARVSWVAPPRRCTCWSPTTARARTRWRSATPTARFRRRSLFIVLTDLVEAAVEQALLPALPILTRRHLVVVAAVQDPAVQRLGRGRRHRVGRARRTARRPR